MTIDETIQKLIDLKLHALAKSVREMLDMPPNKQLSFQDQLGLLVDREWADRENRRVARRVKEARLSVRAAPEEILCDAARGLERATLRELTACQWVRSHHNLVILGPTGVGKSFLANALAQSAIRQGFRALFVRVPRLLEQLAIARASADYSATLERIAESIGGVFTPIYLSEYRRSVDACRAQMEAADFDAAWAEGRAMRTEQVIADALVLGR